MDLVYYTPHQLYSEPGMAAVDPMQVSFSQMFNPSISLIDRTGTINCPPIKTRTLDPMPSWYPSSSFEDICRARYDSILRDALDSDRRIVIFYSGGIDSTLIAALAISHPGWESHRDRVWLAFSNDSIRENPLFWRDHLLKEFGSRLLNSTAYHSIISNPRDLCITGEFADNIFGSLTLKSYMDVTGDTDAIHKPFASTGREWLIGKVSNEGHREGCTNRLDLLIKTSPRVLESNHDCFWWLNFVLKWQAVKFRLSSHAPTAEMVDLMARNVVHFFETTEFQNWAVMTNEDKVLGDWFSYKLPAKKIILDVNGDQDYFRYKTKYPSIPGLTRYGNAHNFIYLDGDTGKYLASKIRIS